MNITQDNMKQVELRTIQSQSKDILEGNSRLVLLDHVTVPWSVISRQLTHIYEYNQKHDLTNVAHSIDLGQNKKEENITIENKGVKLTSDIKNHSDAEAIHLAQILMWVSLPAIVMSIIAIISVGVLAMLLIVWGLTGTVAPASVLIVLALVGAVSSLVAGPLVVYSDRVEGLLRTEYVRLLEDKVKALGGSL